MYVSSSRFHEHRSKEGVGNREESRGQDQKLKLAEPEELEGYWTSKSEPERVSLKNPMPRDGCLKN